jgi:potassium-transporting ATPase potassium-binding subunit
MTGDLTHFGLYVLILAALTVPMGMWLAHTFTGVSHTRVELLTYRILGIDPDERMSWKRYGMVLLDSNAAMMGLGYFLLRIKPP